MSAGDVKAAVRRTVTGVLSVSSPVAVTVRASHAGEIESSRMLCCDEVTCATDGGVGVLYGRLASVQPPSATMPLRLRV